MTADERHIAKSNGHFFCRFACPMPTPGAHWITLTLSLVHTSSRSLPEEGGQLLKQAIVAGLTATAVVATVAGCEVTQINWSNHFYAVSRAGCAPQPLTVGGVTLNNGTGTVGYTTIQVSKVYRADVTGDRVLDAIVLLQCHDNGGGNATGSEIQIFTRDAKPVARLTQPDLYGSGNPFGSHFDANNITVRNGVLYTGAIGYRPGDAHCCASAYDVYRWDWNGRAFTPVHVNA